MASIFSYYFRPGDGYLGGDFSSRIQESLNALIILRQLYDQRETLLYATLLFQRR